MIIFNQNPEIKECGLDPSSDPRFDLSSYLEALVG